MAGLFKSISGIAKSTLGSVSKVRSVLDMNPGLLGMAFPPQVSMGLKAASTVGGFFGIKVPTEKDLLGFAQGKLDNLLGGIRSKTKKPLADIEAIARGIYGTSDSATRVFSKTISLQGLSPEEMLQSISWLL